MGNNRKCTASKEATPRTTFGVQFSRKPFPGYAKNAYPGLMYLHASGVASPKGCTELSPGWSVLCDTRGFESTGESHPGRGARIILDSSGPRPPLQCGTNSIDTVQQ